MSSIFLARPLTDPSFNNCQALSYPVENRSGPGGSHQITVGRAADGMGGQGSPLPLSPVDAVQLS